MSRNITVAAAQLGPIQMAEPRSVAVERMVHLMERAHRRGVELVVFPELALTTFFPRHYHADISEADHWFETAMPSNVTAPLFAAACRYGIGFHLGYAEMTEDRQPVQHIHPGEPGRRHSAEVPQGASARPRGVRPEAQGAAPREALLRGRQSRLPGDPRADGRGSRHQHGHADMQRPALAGSVARARAAKRRAGGCSATTRRV